MPTLGLKGGMHGGLAGKMGRVGEGKLEWVYVSLEVTCKSRESETMGAFRQGSP